MRSPNRRSSYASRSAVPEINLIAERVRLIENIRLGESQAGVGGDRSRLKAGDKRLAGAGEGVLVQGVARIVGDVGDVEIALAIGEITANAAVAVDAGADVERCRVAFLHLDEQVAIVGIVADRIDGDA